MFLKKSILAGFNRTALFMLTVFVCASGSLDAQTITPATGGSSVSADNYGTGAWTTLTGPYYEESANGQVQNGTIILNVPTGFEFDTGGTEPTVLITRVSGNGPNSRNINNVASGTPEAITSISSTQITFTITDFTTNSVTNSLTWQNVRIRPTQGTPLATGNITTSGTATMSGVTNGVTNFGTLTEVFGAHARLVVSLPGQSFTEGSGNSGSVSTQTAGNSFNIVSLTATDQYYNIVTTYSGAKTIAYSGHGGSLSTYTTSVSFSAGVSTTTLSTTLTKAENTTITATDGGSYGYASSVLTVNPAAFTKMQIIVPGETADPGSATGKSGTPNAQTAGSGFTVTVNAVDTYWNLVSSTNTVGITTSDANDVHPLNAALINGTKDFTVTLKTAGTSTVTATNISDGTKTADTSPSITVNPGAFAKLQILAPGESAAPGTVTGKTGTPSTQTAGTPFNVTVNAVDANWNLVNTVTDNVGITSSDGNATLPGNNTLSSGIQTFSVTLRTGGSATVTASDITDPLKTTNTTPSITVNAGAFTKLQNLVPGESASPGSGTGKTGTPDVQTAGIPFNVTVNAVDADWNLVNTVTDVVSITSSDGGATLPSNAALVSGTGIRSVTFSTNGSFTVTASDVTDPGKTADSSPSISVNPAGTGTVVPATGGGTVSADSVGGGYYTLTGPAYEEGQEGNISAGTIVLNAPTGFEFDNGGTAPTFLVTRTSGSGDDTRNINSVTSGTPVAATSVTTTAITFTITNSSNNNVTNTVTWQNVRVRPTVGYPLATGNLTVSGTASIAGVNGSTNFGTLTQVPGSTANMVVVLPGEDFNEGTGTAGTPTAQTAGSPFTIDSLVAVDQYFNITTAYAGVKTIAYAGPGGSSSSYTTAVNFTAGASTTALTTTLARAEVTTITATESGMYGYASSNLTVNVGTFIKMQLIVPGESVNAGSATGKTGSPNAQTAGTPFSVTINAVDANWNLVPGAPANSITLTTSDVNATMPAPANLSGGTVTFATVTLPTAVTATITATNSSDGSKTADTSPSITVNPGTINKLQALVPGETAAPGTASGKTGTPLNQASGSPFAITVNAVDANWNLVSSTDLIQITSSDGAATLPSNANLVAGTKDFTVTLNTSGAQTVTATDVTNGSVTAGTSASITVAAVIITAATGGSTISADDFGTGSWTSLTGPAYDEAASGDVGTGTFIINVPDGFIFDVGGTAPTVLVTRISGGGGDSRNINSVSSGTSVPITTITDSTVTFTITSTSNSGVTNRLTWQNLRVRPTAGTPLATGNLTKTGTSTMTGITNGVTNFGTLTEIHGTVNKLVITLPGETFTAGSGNSGTPEDQIENVPFNISSITATDQYFNIVLTYDSTGATVAYSGPSGSPTYTTSVNFVDGISTTTLATTLTAIENTTITASMGGGSVSGPASSSFNVFGAPKTWDGGAATANWNDATNWSPDGVPTSANDVTLDGAFTINVNVAANTKNFTLNHSGVMLTILSGNSITVNGNMGQSAGTFNTENTFPAVSGTASLTGGTFGYSGTGDQDVSPQTYSTLSFGGSGTKTLLGSVTVNGNLVVGGTVTVTDDGYQIVGNAGGTVSIGSGTSLILGNAATATAFPSMYIAANITINSAGTVTYASDQPQIVDALNFGNLVSTGIGARTLQSSQTVGIAGTFTPGTNSYTVTGSTVNMNGSGSQSIPSFIFHHFTLGGSGSKTAVGPLTVNGNFLISGSAIFDAGESLTHTFAGNWTVNSSSGTPMIYTTSSVVNFNIPSSPAATSIGGTSAGILNFDDVNVNNTSGFSTSLDLMADGNLAIASNVTMTNSAEMTITGNITGGNGSSTIVNANGGILNAGSALLITGTLTATAVSNSVNYIGTTGAQTVKATTYHHLGIDKTAQTATISTTMTVNGDLTVTSGSLSVTAGTFTVSGTATIDGTLTMGAATVIDFNGSATNNGTINVTSTTGTKDLIDLTNNGTINFTVAETVTLSSNLVMGTNGVITGTNTGIINVGGNLNVNGTGNTIGRSTITVTGTTNVTGAIDFNNATGTKTFIGLITVSGSGEWSNSGNSAIILRGGLTHSGASFSSGTGIYTFNTNPQSIAGTSQLTISRVTVTGVIVTNDNTNGAGLTIAVALVGTGGLTNPMNATLNIGGTSTITTLTATAVPNTVRYTSTTGAQTVKATSYHHLTVDKTSTVATISAATTINGDLNVTTGTLTVGGGIFAANGSITIDGTMTMGAATSIAMNSTTNVNGVLTITSATGTKNFTGINLNSGSTLNGNATETLTLSSDLVMANNSVITGTATSIIAVGGNLTINGTGILIGRSTINVTGTTNVTGSVDFNSATGTKTFIGALTIAGGAAWSSTGNTAFVFQGGLTHNGVSFASGTGIYTFNTNPQSIDGASQLTFARLTATGVTVTYGNTHGAGLTVTTALAGTGGLTMPVNGLLTLGGTSAITTLSVTASPNTVIYNGTAAAQTVKATTYHHLVVDKTTQNATISGTTTVNGDVTITSGTLTLGGGTIVVTGTTTVDGTLALGAATTSTLNGAVNVNGTVNVTSATGTKTFGQLLTLNGGSGWNNSANEGITFLNGLTHNGATFTPGTGAYTFTTNAQSIDGSSALTLGAVTITGVVVNYINSNVAGLTINGALGGTGQLIMPVNGILTLGAAATITTLTVDASPNVVRYVSTAAAQTIKATTYHHLEIDKSTQTASIAGTVTVNGDLTMTSGVLSIGNSTVVVTGTTDINGTLNFTNGTGTKNFSDINLNANSTVNFTAVETASLSGSLTIGNAVSITGTVTGFFDVGTNLVINGSGVTIGRSTITVTGTTSISGDVDFNNATGTKTFVGNVTLSGSGAWSSTANSAFTFRNGLTHNGSSFVSGSGIYTFNTNSQALDGSSVMSFDNITVTGVTLSNDNSNGSGLTITTSLVGTGAFTNLASRILNLSGTTTGSTLTASAAGNTVNYNGSTQTVRGITYHHLQMTAAGLKTGGAAIAVNGDLLISGTASFSDAGFQVTGNASGTFSLASGSVLSLGSVGTATLFPANFITANVSLDAASEVIYNSNQSQTISVVPTYGNLTLTSTASVTKTISGTTTVATTVTVNANNILSITGGSILNINNGDLELFGNINNAGTINIGQ